MNPTQETVADFMARRDREQRRQYARRPTKIGEVLAKLITARGYGRVQADAELADIWRSAVGESLACYSRPGRLYDGKLQVTVSNSTIVQELTFQKDRILAALAEQKPGTPIRDLRFRVGSLRRFQGKATEGS